MKKHRLSLLQAKMLVLMLMISLQVSQNPVAASSGQEVIKSDAAPNESSREASVTYFPSKESPHDDFDEESNAIAEHRNNPEMKVIQKRSTYGYDYSDDSDDYGNDWNSNSNDPGYESYMQTIQYDPMMAWGRRKRNREDQYRVSDLPKRSFNTFDFQDPAYYHHFMQMKRTPNYMDSVYMPHHFFNSFKRSLEQPDSRPVAYRQLTKRSPSPLEMGSRGFHEGIFTHHFGDFSPVKRRKRDAEKESVKDHGDISAERPLKNEAFYPYDGQYIEELGKRRFGMDASGFHGDTFNDGWGTFSTMKRNKQDWDSSIYYDPYSNGLGYFYGMNKRRPEMDAMGFHGDTFHNGFGDFYTMKKRRPEMTSSGFFGDTFSNGFGDFYTMKKRSASNVGSRSKREAVKRRPEMTSSGFFGDTFSNGFGDFYTMKRTEQKKRRPEMTSSGFFGDTFSNGFGDFYTMKKRINQLNSMLMNEKPYEASSPAAPNTLEPQNLERKDLVSSLNKESVPNKDR